MSWNKKIYVATASLGVYYTSNFSDPSVQPTWTAVNTGLGATTCREFWLDPFDPENRQYVLIGVTGGLYARINQGNWNTILTVAEAAVLLVAAGYTATETGIFSFCVDSTVAGRLWCFVGSTGIVTHFPRGYFALYSDDYGANWTVTVAYSSFNNYGEGYIRAQGDNVFLNGSAQAGGSLRVWYSTNKGTNWTMSAALDFNTVTNMTFNNLLPNQVYLTIDVTGNNYLTSYTNGGVITNPQTNFSIPRLDSMWFSLTDANHQRMVKNSALYVTTDEWGTKSDSGAIAPEPYSIAPQVGLDEDSIFVGLTLGTHVIGCLTSEADTTATGIAGTNAGSAPYTDSIPNTCGGLASMGIQSILNVGTINAYGVVME